MSAVQAVHDGYAHTSKDHLSADLQTTLCGRLVGGWWEVDVDKSWSLDLCSTCRRASVNGGPTPNPR